MLTLPIADRNMPADRNGPGAWKTPLKARATDGQSFVEKEPIPDLLIGRGACDESRKRVALATFSTPGRFIFLIRFRCKRAIGRREMMGEHPIAGCRFPLSRTLVEYSSNTRRTFDECSMSDRQRLWNASAASRTEVTEWLE